MSGKVILLIAVAALVVAVVLLALSALTVERPVTKPPTKTGDDLGAKALANKLPRAPEVLAVTEEELEKAVNIMLRRKEATSILNKTRWWVHLAGPYLERGEKYGVHLLVRLEEPLWVEGVFWIGGGTYTFNISTWTEAFDAIADFRTDELVVFMPGPGRPAKKIEITDATLKAAEEVARRHQLAQRGELWLRAVIWSGFKTFETGVEYPRGVADFAVISDREVVAIVAVDLARMEIDERLTGEYLEPLKLP